MNMEEIKSNANELLLIISNWASSPKFYAQAASIIVAFLLAIFVAHLLKKRVPQFKQEPDSGKFLLIRKVVYQASDLLLPMLAILFLAISIEVSMAFVEQSWLIRIAQSLAVILFLYTAITRFIKSPFINGLFRWIGIPLATLHVFDWLDNVVMFLEDISLEIGNIHLSAYALARTLIFGSILFWLGRISNSAGQQVIRNSKTLDTGTREVFAKLFEMILFIALFLLLLQVMGINLTTLAVFGGALGVGLGFGLQQIAANFISGIIILLDRSITVGDYIELEDGTTGILRELNMRSATLETYDGKDIMVPNEQFITTRFINWTHKDIKQRYDLEFSVAYDTDLHQLFKIIRDLVGSHPQVLSGPDVSIEEQPDAEISSFGDSGVNILVEYWMEGVDDGENRVNADLLLMIWDALKENNIDIPFPQREVRILEKT